jgi:outer membrane protein OmpA-like peptidoglycan-associated protein
VLFATNSYTLSERAKGLLAELTEKTKASRIDSVIVEGHTDNQGSLAINQSLSRNRAASVVAFLRNNVTSQLTAKAFASERPIADNRTPGGRQKNRRVEIYLYIRE